MAKNVRISNEINKGINDILVRDHDLGTLHGRVCIMCDRLLKKREAKLMGFDAFAKYAKYMKGEKLDVCSDLRRQYRFSCFDNRKTELLSGCLLSPRSKLVVEDRKTPKVVLCGECRPVVSRYMKQGKLPRFAVCNGMTIGETPDCLECLNDVELALVSQARFRGHLFSYWGGCHKAIKGWHSFYDVDAGHTTAVVGAVSQLTKCNNIAVVLCGPFTDKQREQVKKNTEVDVNKVKTAFEWLKQNNKLYKDVEMPEIGQPKVIDTSSSVSSSNTDIESKEEITVVFPDGSVSTGGCNDRKDFEKALAEIRSKSKDSNPILFSKPTQQALRDFEEHNLLKAFPKQFPYGHGSHSDLNIQVSQNGYLNHLLHLSIPSFHEACFVLTAHNMFERSRILTGSLWRVTGNKEPCNVTEDELNQAVDRRLKGLPKQKGPGEDFLKSIRTVRSNLGHTNEAAAAAQAKFLSLTHHFGCPKLLFTVSFDDSLDLRILTLSGKEDAENWIESLLGVNDENLESEIKGLSKIRLKYPGLCAYNFELLLDIILDKVIGNNDKKEGLFGTLEAFGLAVEEQSRKTLHTHIVVYIKGWNDILKSLQSEELRVRSKAEKTIAVEVDQILSTEMTPEEEVEDVCSVCNKDFLKFADYDTLRALRHRHGCQDENLVFARCDTCNINFTGDELAKVRVVEKEHWNKEQEIIKALISRDILEATTFSVSPGLPVGKVNYKYNHHLFGHTRTCFKKGEECRAALPDIPEEETYLLRSEKKYQLHDWKGTPRSVDNVTVRPKRTKSDAYMNTHCKVISDSIAPANSNVSMTTGCRSCIYCTCYTAKGTQKEDSNEWKKMACYCGKRFKETRKESTLFEGLSRLMGAVIVGTSEHVVAAPMAAYLVRNNGSRFKFSHEFQYVPIREMIAYLMGDYDYNNLNMSVLNHDDGCFLSNQVLCYLCRPIELEDLSMIEFFEEWETVRSYKWNDKEDDDCYEIQDQLHPGHNKQKTRRRKKKVLAQFSHWSFPDAATFGQGLWEANDDNYSGALENYCRAALVLFHPFRSKKDLTWEDSFFKKFRRVYRRNKMEQRMVKILANVQLFYNSTRMPGKQDILCQVANKYEYEHNDRKCVNEDDDDETEDTYFEGVFDVEAEAGHESGNRKKEFSLNRLRQTGYASCGFNNLPDESYIRPIKKSKKDIEENATPTPETPFLLFEAPDTESGTKRPLDQSDPPPRDTTTKKLMELVYSQGVRKLQQTSQQETVKADGSVLSIIKWSNKEKLNFDREQKQAFRIITSAFVLTYYDNASVDLRAGSRGRGRIRTDFLDEKTKLKKLSRRTANEPLRMFLDGPGGSGKSRVIEEVLAYSKEYTQKLGVVFDSRTIVVTALSGVAAVSIGGETLHSAVGLNRSISPDDTSFSNTRLLIIDEVSFMSSNEAENLDKKLRQLMRSRSIFGGINMLFCGDFRQLEPCTGNPLYSQRATDSKWTNSINCYIELKGMFRFESDEEWGEMLSRIRRDRCTREDMEKINKRCIKHHKHRIPKNSSYCVYRNHDRSAIDAGIFSNKLHATKSKDNVASEEIIIIKGSNFKKRSKNKQPVNLPKEDKEYIFQNCTDSRLKTGGAKSTSGHFVDPLLKLYKGIRLMLLTNTDVPNGHANGTRVILQSVVLLENKSFESIQLEGVSCRSTEASNVKHLLCYMEDKPEKKFKIEPKEITCHVNAPVPAILGQSTNATIQFKISLTQIPVIANNATTGHKLQGQTKENLVISCWSKRKNWNYVALSRVKNRDGLFLVNPLPHDTDFSIEPELEIMLQYLQTKQPEPVQFNLSKEEERRVEHAEMYQHQQPGNQR